MTTSERATVISAAQFNDALKRAIDEHRCKVEYIDQSAEIINVYRDSDGAYIAIGVPNPLMVAEGVVDPGTQEGFLDYTGEYKFKVTWFDTPPATTAAAEAGANTIGASEGDEIEAALWAGAELMGNVSDDGYEDAVKAKTTFANYRARAIALNQKFNDLELQYASELQFELDNYDKIWSLVTGDKIGKWDYPAQVIRYVEHMADDYKAVRDQTKLARTMLENMIYNLKHSVSGYEAKDLLPSIESISAALSATKGEENDE